MRPTLTIAALIAASPALAARCPQGEFYRVRLDECVRLSSPLARPYLSTANVDKKINTPLETAPLVTVKPPAADPLPDEVDEAAWLMMPLLRAVEARWASMVSPPRAETPPSYRWPSLSVYGPRNF